MLHYIKIFLPANLINYWRPYMARNLIDYDLLGISSYQTVSTWTIICMNECQIDLKLCSGNRNSGDSLWSECVLFNPKGYELSCTDVSDDLAGEYELEYDDDKYIVNVVPMTELDEKQLKSNTIAETFAIKLKETNNTDTVIQHAHCENDDQIIVELYNDNTYKHTLIEPTPDHHNRKITIERYCNHFDKH